jgi:hypothetical protein
MTTEAQLDAVLARMEERVAVLLRIDSPEAAQAAVDEAKVIRQNREAIEAFTAAGIKAAHEAHRKALAARDKYTKPMAERERQLTAAALAFGAAQRERARRELAAATAPSEVAAAVALVAPKPTGLSERATPWQWAVDSLADLVRAVAEDRAPLEYLTTNDGAIGRAVRSARDKFTVPGIRTWVERTGVLR